jgi:hypothetical protein
MHLFSGARLPFTAAYFTSIALTLYFSIGVSSSFLSFDTSNILVRVIFLPSLSLVLFRDIPDFLYRFLFISPVFPWLLVFTWCILSCFIPCQRLTASRPRDGIQRHNTIMTLICSIVQMIALIWYLFSYFPMGTTGLRFASRVAGSRVTSWMND